jgi:hypothetical protein
MSTAAQQDHPVSLLGGVLSYLVPGLGQICQGRVGKGVLFMVSLLGLFHLGQAMGEWKNVYIPVTDNLQWDDRFADQKNQFRIQRLQKLPSSLYQRWHYLGQFWIGIPAWPALWQYFEMPVPAKETNPFWHDFQRPPSEDEINRFWVSSDKTPDLGWIYTVIAGVLNILVIYDAYAGPAHHGDPEEEKKKKKPEEAAA